MPKVKIVFDAARWAWHFRAQDLQAFAPKEYNVEIHQASTFLKHVGDKGFLDGVDSIFYMSWASCPTDRVRKRGAKRIVSLVTSAGPAYRRFNEEDWNTRIVTASRNFANAHSKLPKFDAVIAVNEFLANACREHTTKPVHLIPSGVNTDLFVPLDGLKRNERFTVGWCANIKGIQTVKGHDEILVPLMAETPEWDWQVNTNDRRNAWPREKMVQWYQALDAFVCTSICEGTPSPLFEAASCGVPIVSTDVGCVKDWPLPHDCMLVAPAYTSEKESIQSRGIILSKLQGLADMSNDERTILGVQLRADICKRFDYRVLAPKYLEAICQT